MANELERIDDFRINGVMPQFQLMTQQVIGQLIWVLESDERHDVSKALEVWRKDRASMRNNSLRYSPA